MLYWYICTKKIRCWFNFISYDLFQTESIQSSSNICLLTTELNTPSLNMLSLHFCYEISTGARDFENWNHSSETNELNKAIVLCSDCIQSSHFETCAVYSSKRVMWHVSLTQSRLSARRSDTTAARLAEVGRRWCHCLYAPEGCVLAMERKGKQGSRRAWSWRAQWGGGAGSLS